MDSPSGLKKSQSFHDFLDVATRQRAICDSIAAAIDANSVPTCSNIAAPAPNGAPSDNRKIDSPSGLTLSQSFDDLIDLVLQRDDKLCDSITTANYSNSVSTQSNTAELKPNAVPCDSNTAAIDSNSVQTNSVPSCTNTAAPRSKRCAV